MTEDEFRKRHLIENLCFAVVVIIIGAVALWYMHDDGLVHKTVGQRIWESMREE